MAWKPISATEFRELFESQYRELTREQRRVFDRYKVDFWKALFRRSGTPEDDEDDEVFVVAQNNDGVLYFGDVEYGFNISRIDDAGRMLGPGR